VGRRVCELEERLGTRILERLYDEGIDRQERSDQAAAKAGSGA